MAVVHSARTRPLFAVLLVVSGFLALIGAMVNQVPGAVVNGNWWWFDFSAVLLGLAFVVLALSAEVGPVGRGALWVAAGGWLVLALGVVLTTAVISSAGAVLALVGGLVAAVIAQREHALTRLADILLVVAMAIAVVYLLDFITAILPTTAQLVVRALFALSLIATGILALLKR